MVICHEKNVFLHSEKIIHYEKNTFYISKHATVDSLQQW